MTLTLPSEFHKMKMDKKTKALIANPKYNHVTPKEAVKHLLALIESDKKQNNIR